MVVRVRRSPKLTARAKILGAVAGYSEYEAMGRLVELWAQCQEDKSDVLEEKYIRAHLGPRGVDALLEADLGERLEDGVRVRGAREEIDAQDRRVDAARRAGEASGHARSSPGTGNAGSTPDERSTNATSTPRRPNVNGKATANSLSDLRSSGSLFPEASASSETSGDLKQDGGRRKVAGPMPRDFAPGETHRTYAAEQGLDLALELERCRDWYAGKGQAQKDWSATFRNWLRNEARYRAERGHPAGPRTHGSAAAFDLAREAEERELAQRGKPT